MATVAEIREQINTRLLALLRQLRERQHEHRALHGRYWQGVRTHDTLPKDGAAAPADYTRKASDQDESWSTLGLTLPANLECALQVDTYTGPSGDGYTATVIVEFAGKVWTRTANVGPESWRAKGWERVNGVA